MRVVSHTLVLGKASISFDSDRQCQTVNIFIKKTHENLFVCSFFGKRRVLRSKIIDILLVKVSTEIHLVINISVNFSFPLRGYYLYFACVLDLCEVKVIELFLESF